MRIEELDIDTRMRIERSVSTLPPRSVSHRWYVHNVEPWLAGVNGMFIVELKGSEGHVLRGCLVMTSIMDLFMPDADSGFFLSTWYTDSSLERYNAGHDPHYRGM